MRTRIVALSALAVVVTLGVLSMHAFDIGHGSAAMSRAGMAHERATNVTTSASVSETGDANGGNHTSPLPALCVAILSVGLALAATALAGRALAHSRTAPPPLVHWVRLATRWFAGRPPPLLAPLRN